MLQVHYNIKIIKRSFRQLEMSLHKYTILKRVIFYICTFLSWAILKTRYVQDDNRCMLQVTLPKHLLKDFP